MRTHRARYGTFGIALGLAAGCASDAGTMTTDGATAAVPAPETQPSAAAAGSAASATPSNNLPLTPTAAATAAAASNAAGMTMAAAPNSAAAAAAAAPATAIEPAGPPDTCRERRGSYSKPCHNDPDPCGLNSGWAGDQYCLLPPKAGEGVQIHFGPSDFKNMAEIQKYVIHSGE